MSNYKKLSTKPDFVAMQNEITQFWANNDIKHKVLEMNKDSKSVFSFYEGPPTANGNPHAGHVLTRSLKDVYTRYAGMSGNYVPRKGGWDTHGLPVEIEVEKSLNISGKQDIEAYGVENFVKACKSNVWTCIDRWKEFSNKVGYSLDLDADCYNPYENKYIESVWWSLKTLSEKGLLYKGYKILPVCPSCQTALSSHEVAQGYKDRKDLTVTVKFFCPELNANFIVWTTTPWTLPSNVALCVNAKEEYALVERNGEKFILAKELVPKHFDGEENYSIESIFKGNDLIGKKYVPLFDFAPQANDKGYRVVADDYVNLSDGTGIVHIAPAYGEDDNRVGKVWDLPFLQMVDISGHFVAQAGKYAGRQIFDAENNVNEEIVRDLSIENKVFSKAKHIHSYPHCWRCKSPLIYFAHDAWFIKTSAYKDELIKANNSINWFPKSFKEGRMGNFLENNIDWCLSRNRFWGTPLPVWTCECGHHTVIGSIKELIEKTGCDENIELHKPYIDEVTMKCDKCGKEMHREKEVIDVWYDSGAMPFAQFHYPFENKEEFEKRFPADFVFEGYDQTRGWFYTLLAINVALFGRAPMKNCLANGMICDAKGEKMSKSKGNYEDPMIYLKKYGGDVVRFMFYSNGQPYNDVIFSENLLIETQRKFNDVLYNSFVFYNLYADINNYIPKKAEPSKNIMDKFILSKLNTLIKFVGENLHDYKATEASRALIEFVDILSNWYIRVNRKRFYDLDTPDNYDAFNTLYEVLSKLSKICAPFIPFLAEEIYQNIERPFDANAKESVHLCDFPAVDGKAIDVELENNIELVRKYCELGHSARERANIKIKQPLGVMYVSNEKFDSKPLNQEFLDIICDELNILKVEQRAHLGDFVDYVIKPNLPKIGPKYKSKLNQIREYFTSCDANLIRNSVKDGGTYTFELDGEKIELIAEDLLITSVQKGEYLSVSDETLTIVLDCHITDDLKKQGYVRQFVSKVQNMRKSFGFEIVDRIELFVCGDKDVISTLFDNKEKIMSDLLALKFEELDDLKNLNIDKWQVSDEIAIDIGIKKA